MDFGFPVAGQKVTCGMPYSTVDVSNEVWGVCLKFCAVPIVIELFSWIEIRLVMKTTF